MATLRGILGQDVPAAVTLTDVYTVPASKSATLKVIATEQSGAASTFRVSIAVAGAVDALEQYIAYDVPIADNDTGSTVTVMCQAAAVVRCYSANGAVAFTVTGLEQDS